MVNSLVILELADAGKRLVAVPAPEAMVGAVRKLVFTHLMIPEQVGHLEGLSTVRTLVFRQQLHTLVSDSLVHRPELRPTLCTNVGSVFTLPLPVPGQVRFSPKSFPTMRALVGLHRRVEPLVFKKLKAILKAAPTQRAVMSDSSSWVAGFDRGLPGRQRHAMTTSPIFASSQMFH